MNLLLRFRFSSGLVCLRHSTLEGAGLLCGLIRSQTLGENLPACRRAFLLTLPISFARAFLSIEKDAGAQIEPELEKEELVSSAFDCI